MIPRSAATDITTTTAGAKRRLLKITLRRDGTILVIFPGLQQQTGIVARTVFQPPRKGIQKCLLAESGFTTSHLVKYSHHADGRAHFSQDTKVRTEIRKQAEPLDTQVGHLFTLHLAGIQAFKTLDVNSGRSEIELSEARMLHAFNVICTRHKIDDLGADPVAFWQSSPPGIVRPNGTKLPGAFLGPPAGTRFENRPLFLRVDKTEVFSKPNQPALFFIGGFDSPAVLANEMEPTSMLVAMYPCTNKEHLIGHVPSIDLTV